MVKIIPGTGGMNQYQYEAELFRKLNAGETINEEVARAAGYGDSIDSHYSYNAPEKVSQDWIDRLPPSVAYNHKGEEVPLGSTRKTSSTSTSTAPVNTSTPIPDVAKDNVGMDWENFMKELLATLGLGKKEEEVAPDTGVADTQNYLDNYKRSLGVSGSNVGNAGSTPPTPKDPSGARIGIQEDGTSKAISRYIAKDMWANKGVM